MTQNRSFWRCSSQPISSLSTQKWIIHNKIYWNTKWTQKKL